MFGFFARKKLKSMTSICRLRGFEQYEKREMLAAGPPKVVAVEVSGSSWSPSFLDYLETNSLGTSGYAIPTGSSAQTKAVPWSNVNQLHIRFNEDVMVDATDLTFSGINTTQYQFSNFTYNVETFEAVWTLDNFLTHDVMLFDLDASGLNPVVDLSNTTLDGEWTDNVTNGTSGNGTAGGDFQFKIKANPGDYNQNNEVASSDYHAVNSKLFKDTNSAGYSVMADINGSGTIDTVDLNTVYALFFNTTPAGEPAGWANDGPTAGIINALEIFDDAATTSISLHAAFADAETSDSNMTYVVISNSDASLFDTVSINNSTGMLNLSTAANKMGRSRITVQATDAGGLSTKTTFTVDVDRVNAVPTINLAYYESGVDTYTFEGSVDDADDSVVGTFIQFSGLFDARSKVNANKSFSLVVVGLETNGLVEAMIKDLQNVVATTSVDTSEG